MNSELQILIKKLRLKTEQPVTILNRPDKDYFKGLQINEAYPAEAVDMIILFVKDLEELKYETLQIIHRQLLNPEGRLLIAYPKKGNPAFDSYVHRDDILPALDVDEEGYIKGSDYKFNQMAKLDEIYTIAGLKRVARGAIKRPVSQSVSDYIQYIPELIKSLAEDEESLAFFQSLTPGYQRNWARYVYSARQQATQEKRRQEMADLLKKGFKSKDQARS